MSIPFALMTLGFLGLTGLMLWAFLTDRRKMIDHHERQVSGWVSLLDESRGRSAELADELHDARAHACDLRAELEWARITTVTQAFPEFAPTVLAAHRATVTPIRGVGR